MAFWLGVAVTKLPDTGATPRPHANLYLLAAFTTAVLLAIGSLIVRQARP